MNTTTAFPNLLRTKMDLYAEGTCETWSCYIKQDCSSDEKCRQKEKDDKHAAYIRRLAGILRIVFAVLLSLLVVVIAIVLFVISRKR